MNENVNINTNRVMDNLLKMQDGLLSIVAEASETHKDLPENELFLFKSAITSANQAIYDLGRTFAGLDVEEARVFEVQFPPLEEDDF